MNLDLDLCACGHDLYSHYMCGVGAAWCMTRCGCKSFTGPYCSGYQQAKDAIAAKRENAKKANENASMDSAQL